MRASVDDFVALVREFLLRKIKTKKENVQALNFFRKVRSVGEDNLSQGEIDFLQVLGALIIQLERKH